MFRRSHKRLVLGGLPSVARHILFLGGDAVSLATLKAVVDRTARLGGSVQVVHPPDPAIDTTPEPTKKKAKRSKSSSAECFERPPCGADSTTQQNVVAAFCRERCIKSHVVDHPKSLLKSSLCIDAEFGKQFDATVVCSCRYFIPNKVLECLPPAINMHPSLLPKYRGASPIYETLRRGDVVGGVSVIKLEPRLLMDSGDVLYRRELPLAPSTDVREYFPMAASAGAEGVTTVLDNFEAMWRAAEPQPNNTLHFSEDPDHAPLLAKHPGKLDWTAITGAEAFNTWRAFVSHSPVGCLLCKGNAPCAAKIKSKAKLQPLPMCFAEAQHETALSTEVKKELDIVYNDARPGAAYFTWTKNHDGKRVGAVRCREGWFFYRLATLQSSRPIDPSTLAATIECKPGFVYNDVFQTPAECPGTTP